MIASIDGRIDCDMVDKISGDEYYEALNSYACPSTLEGRTTMAIHYAEKGDFVPADPTPVGCERIHAAVRAEGYAISCDTAGTLRWGSNAIDGRPLLCLVSEKASREYLAALEKQGISYIATGKERIDLARAMQILAGEFGVSRLAVVGGGHINAAFLEAGLLDAVSLQIAPGIDGRGNRAAVFDGLVADRLPVRLTLESVKTFPNGTVWLQYTV